MDLRKIMSKDLVLAQFRDTWKNFLTHWTPHIQSRLGTFHSVMNTPEVLRETFMGVKRSYASELFTSVYEIKTSVSKCSIVHSDSKRLKLLTDTPQSPPCETC